LHLTSVTCATNPHTLASMPDGVRGNPGCWHDIFDFDYCCDLRHGAAGNDECWDGYYDFNHCCRTPLFASAPKECWAEARQNLLSSPSAAARHPVLKDDANLATFCCHASALSSEVCWAAGRGGREMLLDHSTGPAACWCEGVGFRFHCLN
ncbi:unnamed protein product, partial [Effrenium voratum]